MKPPPGIPARVWVHCFITDALDLLCEPQPGDVERAKALLRQALEVEDEKDEKPPTPQ